MPFVECLSGPTGGRHVWMGLCEAVADIVDGAAVVAAYHDLWRIEESFRMAKSDLQARPVFHRKRDSIEAHLTIVFAALAVARYLQQRTDLPRREPQITLSSVAGLHMILSAGSCG